MKKEELISKFHEQAWLVLKLFKEDKETTEEMSKQYRKSFEAFIDIPMAIDYANFEDVQDAISWVSMELHKPFHEITKGELVKYLDVTLLSKPKTFDFYFRLGETSGFEEGYTLGNGQLYSFTNLPISIQKDFRAEFPYRFSEDKLYGTETLEKYTKRREREWYMQLQVESIGQSKAREKAVAALKRNIGVMKLLYDIHGSMFEFDIQSPFDYRFNVDDLSWSSGAGYQRERQPAVFIRRKYFDEMISDVNSMITSKNPSDLEKRVLNVIDIFGLIDDSTPLHLRFLLSIISLESLLLDEGEKDYLGWKLAEKIAYLVGESRAWFATFHKVKPEDERRILTTDFLEENLTNTRIGLDRTIRKFYEKRSGFAHGGLEANVKKRISVYDYNLASSILLWTVEKLLELRRKNGIDHIQTKGDSAGKEDAKSLNHYIETLRYS